MKVLVLGGYGVFGARLARLLVRDGHDVTVAGRNRAAAQALASDIGCTARQVDRAQAHDVLAAYDVVIDAAGPFHTYGTDPYGLPKAAIARGTHYLDLCDNAAFCAGIKALDAAARDAGVCVVSGLSSVPALSSAAVTALAGDDTPLAIETAILPGNRAPRGLSVMHAILAQAGRPMQVWRGGQWETHFGWSAPAKYDLPRGITRQGWQITVPDLHLFPSHFGAQSVQFRAGLELGIMRYGLAAFAQIQRLLNLPVTSGMVGLFKRAADLLAPFGSGRGGMSVQITTAQDHRRWRLLAADGDGPFIPAIPARALLRRAALPIGAGPALGVITLSEAEDAMDDLEVTTEQDTQPRSPIFAQVLGQDLAHLPAAVQATHDTIDVSRWEGRSAVTRGTGLWPRLIGICTGFPPASADTPVRVIKICTAKGETWHRHFGRTRFTSHLAARAGVMTERFGPITFALALKVQDQTLMYPVTSAAIGPIPLPKWLLPVSQAHEYVAQGRFHFDVAIKAPITGQLIVHYKGWLTPQPAGADLPCTPKS